ncbi:hypothetical protein BDR06DRAFT_977841 [Suillus hirtellus]|nr:hypothetical protein BDR06DRAFT_977841 [Suillus hirtellus]
MIASTHINAIVDCASVPALITDELASGKVCRKSIMNVDEVLASMATGNFSIKLPAKRNKVTGKMSSGCYKFFFANWHNEMEAYMKSIGNRDKDSKLIIISRALICRSSKYKKGISDVVMTVPVAVPKPTRSKNIAALMALDASTQAFSGELCFRSRLGAVWLTTQLEHAAPASARIDHASALRPYNDAYYSHPNEDIQYTFTQIASSATSVPDMKEDPTSESMYRDTYDGLQWFRDTLIFADPRACTRELLNNHPFIVQQTFIEEFTERWETPSQILFDKGRQDRGELTTKLLNWNYRAPTTIHPNPVYEQVFQQAVYKALARLTEAGQYSPLAVFESLSHDERVSILDPKGTNKLPTKGINKPNNR